MKESHESSMNTTTKVFDEAVRACECVRASCLEHSNTCALIHMSNRCALNTRHSSLDFTVNFSRHVCTIYVFIYIIQANTNEIWAIRKIAHTRLTHTHTHCHKPTWNLENRHERKINAQLMLICRFYPCHSEYLLIFFFAKLSI